MPTSGFRRICGYTKEISDKNEKRTSKIGVLKKLTYFVIKKITKSDNVTLYFIKASVNKY